jgi:thiamine-phosphate pyrophosphorylase
MRSRQIAPRRWLIVADQDGQATIATAKSLPRGSGIFIVAKLCTSDLRYLRRESRRRGLFLVRERKGTAERVHNVRELSAAMLRRTPLIFLSPLRSTRTHPDWVPIPRMRAAALAQLGQRRLIALGGMDDSFYATIRPLGFVGWAGISAFRI